MANYQAAKQHILRILDNELSETLTYHGKHHTLDVLAVTEQLCEAEGVVECDRVLLRTAALLHDLGFTMGNKEHERKSCLIARKLLPLYAYDHTAIECICGMIMATKIPQSPRNELEKIICDADLDYLGRSDFYPISRTLFLELKHYGVVRTEDAWNRIQVNFIEQHRYFTKTNQQLRETNKQLRLAELKASLSD